MATSNLVTVVTMAVAAYYVYVSYCNLDALMNPLEGVSVSPQDPTIDALWKEGDKFSLSCFLTGSSRKQRVDMAALREANALVMDRQGRHALSPS